MADKKSEAKEILGAIGKEVIALLQVQPGPSGLYPTAFGKKTESGIGAAIVQIVIAHQK